MNILLKGYYGFGNLGDDLLFITSWRWLRENFPAAKLAVVTESPDASVLSRLVGEQVPCVRNQDNVLADVIVHGGGGTYFDFKPGPPWCAVVNAAISLLGPAAFGSVYKSVQRLRNRTWISATVRVGIGIGVGSYSRTSRRLAFDSFELSQFNSLFVRDAGSRENLRRMGFNIPVVESTDLCFLSSHWKPSATRGATGKVGMVLRDWDYDNHAHLLQMENMVTKLQGRGVSVAFFSFDPKADVEFIRRFGKHGLVHSWNSSSSSLDDYLSLMQECSVIVSSRAHGALAAACLGIPVVCLAIEPKMIAMGNILRDSAAVVHAPFDADQTADVVLKRLDQLDSRRALVAADVLRNEQLILDAVEKLNEVIHKALAR